jgi:hypothetical protein
MRKASRETSASVRVAAMPVRRNMSEEWGGVASFLMLEL